MKNKLLLLSVVAFLLLDLGMALFNMMRTTRVAYVRSQELVYGYFGMKEAMTEYSNRSKLQQANIDSLQRDLNKLIEQHKELIEIKDPSANDNVHTIQKQYADIKQYKQAIEAKNAAEEKKLLEGVLGQINSFVKEYAEEKGYDVVLGTTDAGSLLYGNEAYDITDELIAALNKDHQGVPAQ